MPGKEVRKGWIVNVLSIIDNSIIEEERKLLHESLVMMRVNGKHPKEIREFYQAMPQWRPSNDKTRTEK